MSLDSIFKLLKGSVTPSFVAFLGATTIIWSLNKLSSVYSNIVKVPISISGRIDSLYFDGQNRYTPSCNISTKGYIHLSHTIFGYSKAVELPASDLDIVSDTTGNHFLIIESLERALAPRLKDGSLIGVMDSRLRVDGQRVEQKRVAIKANISTISSGEFMQTSDVVLSPSMIAVYGNRSVLDTLKFVYTEPLVIDNSQLSVNGIAKLLDGDGYSAVSNRVGYSVNFERFVSKNINAKVSVMALNRDSVQHNYTAIPSVVNVHYNIAKSSYNNFRDSDIELFAIVDKDSVKGGSGNYIGDNRYRVRAKVKSPGVDVVSIKPQYVTILISRP